MKNLRFFFKPKNSQKEFEKKLKDLQQKKIEKIEKIGQKIIKKTKMSQKEQ